jgi:hypothetical protein
MFFNRYKKINLYDKFEIVENFFSDAVSCNLYITTDNILSRKNAKEECLLTSEKFDILGKRVFVGNRSFDLSGSTSDIQAFIGKDLIVKMKRGYHDGAYTYYRIVKNK